MRPKGIISKSMGIVCEFGATRQIHTQPTLLYGDGTPKESIKLIGANFVILSYNYPIDIGS
jgi:hypothetical protein